MLPIQRIGAGVAVTVEKQLLLVRRCDNGLWDIPGGAVNSSEILEEAAVRELYEETGIQLQQGALKLVHVFSGPNFRHTYPDGNVVDWITVLYSASLTKVIEAQYGDDACAAKWWPLQQLPQNIGNATKAYFLQLQQP